MTKYLEELVELAQGAASLVLGYYNKNEFGTYRKADKSPITDADLASHEFIKSRLCALDSSIPVVSEEEEERRNLDIISSAHKFWLIDPIDGTWSFVHRNGEFVINIALIENGLPVFGIIANPQTSELHFNDGDKLYKQVGNKRSIIAPNRATNDGYDFLVSSRNLDQKTQDFVDSFTVKTLTPVSSAYKYSLIAEGQGDIYPRFKKTCIWDTAAGHAMLLAAGGDIISVDGSRLNYTGQLINPSFVAVSDVGILPLVRAVLQKIKHLNELEY